MSWVDFPGVGNVSHGFWTRHTMRISRFGVETLARVRVVQIAILSCVPARLAFSRFKISTYHRTQTEKPSENLPPGTGFRSRHYNHPQGDRRLRVHLGRATSAATTRILSCSSLISGLITITDWSYTSSRHTILRHNSCHHDPVACYPVDDLVLRTHR